MDDNSKLKRYKGHSIDAWAIPAFGSNSQWHAFGTIFTIKPNGWTTLMKRFEPTEIFESLEEAQAYGMKLCKEWVDERKRIIRA